jgi:hypothetical protein
LVTASQYAGLLSAVAAAPGEQRASDQECEQRENGAMPAVLRIVVASDRGV